MPAARMWPSLAHEGRSNGIHGGERGHLARGSDRLPRPRPGRFFPDQDFPGLTAVDPEALDAIVVPGAAFDESGMRLGLGAGCYDAFLPQVRKGCLVAGIAFDEQLCEQIPADIHDRRMSVVVTPTRTIEPA